MTAIALSRAHFPVTTLGPGRRLGIWFQGCSIRCPGCVSADTWAQGFGTTTVEFAITSVAPWLADAEGITISGGEPFDQPAALRALLIELRRRRPVDVLVYSGHPVEALHPWLEASPGLIDALISDPYDGFAGQTMALRGSDNQRLNLLTELGRSVFHAWNRPLDEKDRTLDVMFDRDGTVWLAGIPAPGDMVRLRSALAAHGHRAVITAHAEEDSER